MFQKKIVKNKNTFCSLWNVTKIKNEFTENVIIMEGWANRIEKFKTIHLQSLLIGTEWCSIFLFQIV